MTDPGNTARWKDTGIGGTASHGDRPRGPSVRRPRVHIRRDGRHRGCVRAICAAWLLAALPCRAFEQTSSYAKQEIEGWTVYVSSELRSNHVALCAETLKLLGEKLHEIVRQVPSQAVEQLRATPFWVEYAAKPNGAMEYHPSAGWLREHGYNPEKAGGVEISNARNFLEWTKHQFSMVLHELAHGYHFKVLGVEQAEILDAYRHAVDGGAYTHVLLYNGQTVRHYALENVKEYFAEASEAYFGTNDFYPFVRAELKTFDPRGYAAVEKAWGTGRGAQRSNVK